MSNKFINPMNNPVGSVNNQFKDSPDLNGYNFFDNSQGTFNYDGDGQFTYNITDFLQEFADEFNTALDTAKFNQIIKNSNGQKDTINDGDIFNYLDTNKDKRINTAEANVFVNKIKATPTPTPTTPTPTPTTPTPTPTTPTPTPTTPTPTPTTPTPTTPTPTTPTPTTPTPTTPMTPPQPLTINYAYDDKFEYRVQDFMKRIETHYGVSLDEGKFRALFQHKLGANPVMTDYDIYTFLDSDKDLELEDAEIRNIIQRTQRTNMPMPPLDINNIGYMMQQMMQQMMYQIGQPMMQQMMYQMTQRMLPSILNSHNRPSHPPHNHYNTYGMINPNFGAYL